MASAPDRPSLDSVPEEIRLKARIAELETALSSAQQRLLRYKRVFADNPMPAVAFETTAPA